MTVWKCNRCGKHFLDKLSSGTHDCYIIKKVKVGNQRVLRKFSMHGKMRLKRMT